MTTNEAGLAPANAPDAKKETNSFSEDSRLKIIGYRYDFWKFFIGTFVIGAAGVVSTCIFKSYELKISARSAENTYLNSYIGQYSSLEKMDSLHKYDRVAEMFDVLYLSSKDEDLKQSWDTVRKYFQAKANRVNDSSILLRKATKDQSLVKAKFQDSLTSIGEKINHAKSLNQLQAVDSLSRMATVLKDSISASETRIQDLAAMKTKADRYANRVLDVTSSEIAKSSPNYVLLYDADLYAAPGYFNQVTEGVSVLIDNVNDDESTVGLRIEYDPGSGDKEIKKLTIKIGETSSDLYFGKDAIYKLSMAIESYSKPPGLFKRKVVYYHVNLQKKAVSS